MRRKCFDVGSGNFGAFLNRAGSMAHIQSHVPERINHFLNQCFRRIRNGIFKQKQQIHIRVDALFFSAVSAQCDNGIRIFFDANPWAYKAGFVTGLKITIQNTRMLNHEILRISL